MGETPASRKARLLYNFASFAVICLTCQPIYAHRCVQHLLSERRQSLGQQMWELGCENATVGKNGLTKSDPALTEIYTGKK